MTIGARKSTVAIRGAQPTLATTASQSAELLAQRDRFVKVDLRAVGDVAALAQGAELRVRRRATPCVSQEEQHEAEHEDDHDGTAHEDERKRLTHRA